MIDELNNPELINKSIDVVNDVTKHLKRVPHNHINVIYLLREYMQYDCKNYLEIGTYHGGSIITAMKSKYPCNFYGVDFFGPGPNNIFKKIGNNSIDAGITIENVYESIKKLNEFEHYFELLQLDSQNYETFEILNNKIIGGVDLLFIDGCHNADCVTNDFNYYSRLVNQGGFICFDDYRFIKHLKDAVDKLNFENYDIIGCVNSSPKNNYLNSSDDSKFNSTFIIRKK